MWKIVLLLFSYLNVVLSQSYQTIQGPYSLLWKQHVVYGIKGILIVCGQSLPAEHGSTAPTIVWPNPLDNYISATERDKHSWKNEQ